jgi:hypothetical protein
MAFQLELFIIQAGPPSFGVNTVLVDRLTSAREKSPTWRISSIESDATVLAFLLWLRRRLS